MGTRYLILDHYESGKGSAPDGDGSLFYSIYDNADAVLRARINTGIENYPEDSTDYRVIVPDSWSGVITWDLGDPDDPIAQESFDATNEGFFGPGTLNLHFVDSNGNSVSGVGFTVVGVGTGSADSFGRAEVNLLAGTYTITADPTNGVIWNPGEATVASNGETSLTMTGEAPATTEGRGIRLRRYQIANIGHMHIRGFRLKIDVAEVNGDMERNVFLYRRTPPNPHTGDTRDVFLGVASFVDIAEYPTGGPDPDVNLPFFRLDTVELDVRSTAQAEEIWELIHNHVCNLVAALNRADTLVVAESAWCGDEPNPDDSEPSEPSESSLSSASSESA